MSELEFELARFEVQRRHRDELGDRVCQPDGLGHLDRRGCGLNGGGLCDGAREVGGGASRAPGGDERGEAYGPGESAARAQHPRYSTIPGKGWSTISPAGSAVIADLCVLS